jgi:hypothetical protein
MILQPGKLVTTSRVSAAAIAALSMLVIVVDRAAAQIAPSPASSPTLGLQEQGQPPSSPQAEPAPQASPQPAEKPGLFNEMGKVFEKSLSVLPSLKETGEAIDGLNTRAKDAAKDAVKGAGDALSRVAKPGSMVTGRVFCPPIANGTPDCKAAADWLCKTKGYKEGNSLNTDSAEKCSAKVMIPGRQRQAGDCHTNNYVTSALCQ